jgi:hypothetical protein
MNVSEESTLKWPDGWTRTRIQDRKPQTAWKKSMRDQIKMLTIELQRMGATDALVTYHQTDKANQDPGIAVYFSRGVTDKFGWQDALEIDNPAPTVAEIDAAFKVKAMPHHPDRGGDIKIFQQLNEHRRAAIAWIRGEHTKEHELVIACDKYKEQRWNVAAIRLAVHAFRQLDRVGIPNILERTFRGLRAALPAQASSEVKHEPISA